MCIFLFSEHNFVVDVAEDMQILNETTAFHAGVTVP